MNYSPAKIAKLFSIEETPNISKEDILAAHAKGLIPDQEIGPHSRKRKKSWMLHQLPEIGEHFGFIKKNKKPLVMSLFVTKGGVLKTTLTLNIARMAAIHNIKTCVIGLDMQSDVTTCLGYKNHLDQAENFSDALSELNSIQGLPDFFSGKASLTDTIEDTLLPTLSFIPETPELVAMEQSLNLRSRREYWLRDYVIEPLKDEFDLILIDCSPNWNQLITNALVATDVLISPLECKINNFRNLRMFQMFIREFKRDLDLGFKQIYVPTRYSPGRKLSREILGWYQKNLPLCTDHYIRDSVQGEEATAMHLSIPEYAPSSLSGLEINQLIDEIWRLSGQESATLYRPTNHGPQPAEL